MQRFATVLLLSLCAFGAAVGCRPEKKDDADKKSNEPLPASVLSPVSRTVVEYAELNGRTAAVESVDVRAQVSGYLDQICFQPGSLVKAGDVLFKLDDRVYKAVLAQRESDVSAKEAELKRLVAELKRQEQLIVQKATSQQEYDLALAERDKCAAELEAAKANRDRAKIDVDYASVVSPIDGVVSRELVTKGNLVTTGTTLLTSVVAVDELYVFFDVDERTLLRFREEQSAADRNGFEVKFAVGDGEFERSARVDFSEPRLNETTGTLEFRAVFANKPDADGKRPLIPGLRLRVLFPTTPEYDALLVPEEVVSTDQNVKFVYTLDAENKAKTRQIVLGPLQRDNMRVVKSGLSLDDRIVADNLLRVKPGATIEPIPVKSESTVKIVREDGTIIDRDGNVSFDDVYGDSLKAENAERAESAASDASDAPTSDAAANAPKSTDGN